MKTGVFDLYQAGGQKNLLHFLCVNGCTYIEVKKYRNYIDDEECVILKGK